MFVPKLESGTFNAEEMLIASTGIVGASLLLAIERESFCEVEPV